MEDLKPYIVEFDEDGIIKAKVYLDDYVVKDQNWWPVIAIIYNQYTISANNNIQQIWNKKENTYLHSILIDSTFYLFYLKNK